MVSTTMMEATDVSRQIGRGGKVVSFFLQRNQTMSKIKNIQEKFSSLKLIFWNYENFSNRSIIGQAYPIEEKPLRLRV